MKRRKQQVLLQSKKPPLWKLCIAAALITVSILLLYKVFFQELDPGLKYLNSVFALMALGSGMIVSLSGGYHFDFDKDRFREVAYIGPLKFGWWEPLPALDYVSVFKTDEENYQINLWIKGNDFYMLGNERELKVALEKGSAIGRQLSIDVLDAATDPRDSKWL